jgi:hypothetical protein
MPAVYWRRLSSVAEMIAFTGPVRQVDTPPRQAVTIDPAPHATVIASIGG